MVWMLGVVATLLLTWLILVAVLYARRPDLAQLREALRVMPDTLRLVRRLGTDGRVPLGSRLLLWLLLVYLLSPIDLVPDFLPVIGYADDAIATALVLRHLVRRAGADLVAEHWPGTSEGLATLRAVLGVPGR